MPSSPESQNTPPGSDSVELIAEQDRDGAYEIRVSKSTSGVFNSSTGTRAGAAPVAASGSTPAIAHAKNGGPAAASRVNWMIPVGLGAGLLAVGAVVALSSTAAPPPAVDFSEREAAADDVGQAPEERRVRRRIPNDGFRVYQGEMQTTSFPRETATINFAARSARPDAGSEGSTEPEVENANTVEPFEAPQELPDSLEPEVIERMRAVPVRVEGAPEQTEMRAILGQPGGVIMDMDGPDDDEVDPERELGEGVPDFE